MLSLRGENRGRSTLPFEAFLPFVASQCTKRKHIKRIAVCTYHAQKKKTETAAATPISPPRFKHRSSLGYIRGMFNPFTRQLFRSTAATTTAYTPNPFLTDLKLKPPRKTVEENYKVAMTSLAAAMVASTSSSVCASDMKPASYVDGAR